MKALLERFAAWLAGVLLTLLGVVGAWAGTAILDGQKDMASERATNAVQDQRLGELEGDIAEIKAGISRISEDMSDVKETVGRIDERTQRE